MADSVIEVTVENVLSSGNDMILLIEMGKTVKDVKCFISSQISVVSDEQCLLCEGRLIRDHETIHDVVKAATNVSTLSHLLNSLCVHSFFNLLDR